MEPQDTDRRLTTIVATDVVAYSRLMGENETQTLTALKAHRKELIEPKTAQYHGRTVKLMGDGSLMEFGSVVDAVLFAVEVQSAMRKRNADVPEDRRIVYRIGINIGDIIVEGDDIYGDGVNVAARLEGLAKPGDICVARNVFNQVKGKLELNFEHLGDKEVKNIAEPISVYQVIMDEKADRLVTAVRPSDSRRGLRPALMAAGIVLFAVIGGMSWWQPWSPDVEPASVEKMALPLPDKPSIAVLPFENMSNDPEQEYFSDGITEDIITDLSKVSGLFVVARNSTFTFKGKPVKVQQVAEELGVRYVLEGSVRKVEDQVRITAQLVDATTGGHLWAERYDRDLNDIFALQDEITKNIVAALKVKLTEDERMPRRYTADLGAYDLFLQGREYQLLKTKEGNSQAKQLFERAIELDPKFAAAHAELSSSLWELKKMKGLEQALIIAKKAVALDPSLPLAHTRLGYLYIRNRQYEQGIAEARRAIDLEPNFAEGHARLGEVLNLSGKPEESIGLIEKAMRLNPRYPGEYLYNLGQSYYLMGRDEEAIATLKRALTRNPKNKGPRRHLAVLYVRAGRMEEAHAEVAELLKLSSKESIEKQILDCAYVPALLEPWLNDLRKAGYPEKSGST